MDRKVRVRFAPSPTGPLHIGGVRTALYNYLFAKKHGGDCLIRIEDTDQNRYVPGAEEYILEACEWLGIQFDEGPHVGGPHAPYRQSERQGMYRQYAEDLVRKGHAYLAFDTQEELEEMRKKLEAARMPAKYDAVSRMNMKNSLTLPEDEVQRRMNAGEPYVIRLKLPRKEEVRFHDEIRGWVVVHTSQMDDKVLLKNDGMPTYHLANVVDDHLMGITHVIRGEEWLPSAPLHVMLYRYFGWESTMPVFAHLPLILKPEGNGKLSKRDGDRLGFPVFPLQWTDPETGVVSSGYRESGYLPQAVINLLALLGWHPSDNRELFSLDELCREFRLDRVSKSGAKFDQNKARWFNHQYIMHADVFTIHDAVEELLQKQGYALSQHYVLRVIYMMREKVEFIPEIVEKGHYFFKDPESYDTDVVEKKWKGDIPGLMIKLRNHFENLKNWEEVMLKPHFESFASANNVKAGALMPALRLMVSGEAGGPPIFEMLELLGKETTMRRLDHALSVLPGPGESEIKAS